MSHQERQEFIENWPSGVPRPHLVHRFESTRTPPPAHKRRIASTGYGLLNPPTKPLAASSRLLGQARPLADTSPAPSSPHPTQLASIFDSFAGGPEDVGYRGSAFINRTNPSQSLVLVDGVGNWSKAVWTFVHGPKKSGDRSSKKDTHPEYLARSGFLNMSTEFPLTNTRAALFAAIATLRGRGSVFKNSMSLVIATSHNYVVQNAGFISGWIQKGWVTSSGEPVKNSDLWKLLNEQLELCGREGVDVEFRLIEQTDPGRSIIRKIAYEVYDAAEDGKEEIDT